MASLTVTTPAITVQPVNETGFEGSTVTFAVSAVGAPSLGYQWLCNGTNVPGATSSNLVLVNITTAQVGAYEVVITNAYGAVASTVANLYVAMAAPGTVFYSLYSFGAITNEAENALDGAQPYAGLVLGTDGKLYGTTYLGGTNGDGTVFRITTNGLLTSLYSFGAIQDANGDALDGAYPSAGLVLGHDGKLYGTTSGGGTNSNGTVFQITTNGSLTSLYSFGAITNEAGNALDGAYPSAGLVLGSDGNFYGTTYFGGTNSVGTVFRITTNGMLRSLYSFGAITNETQNALDGAYPYAGLVFGVDANLYGTTYFGGTNFCGTVFQITTNGLLRSLYSFGAITNETRNALDGAYPYAGLVLGRDGNLYGTTYFGGTNSDGTVFRLTTNGLLTSLYSFGAITNLSGYSQDGANPFCPLLQGSDGNFYDVTSLGGENNSGTLFKVTTNGILTTLYWFSGGSDGSNPNGNLILNDDSFFYGTTYLGGTNGEGAIFRFSYSVTAPAITNLVLGYSNVLVNGQFQLTAIGGIVGQEYVLLASTNLVNWTPIMGYVYTNPPVAILDPDASKYRFRFYRIGSETTAPVPQLTMSSSRLMSGNSFNVVAYCLPGLEYEIQASTNLIGWITITDLISTNSPFYLSIPISTNSPQEFYRLELP